jgi:hypothetical protein
MPSKRHDIPANLATHLSSAKHDPTGHSLHAEAFGKIKKDHTQQDPHPLYVLNPDVVADGAALASAKPVAWRFLSDGGGKDFAFEFSARPDGQHEFHSVNAGAYTQNLRKLLKDLDGKDELKAKDYKLALLRMPSLYVEAVWLQATSGRAHDLVVPIEPVPPFLTGNRVYTLADFQAVIQTNAGQVHRP